MRLRTLKGCSEARLTSIFERAGGELALDGCELEDRLGARHPGIGRAKAAHDLALTARIRGEQGLGDAPAHVIHAALAAFKYVPFARCLHDLLPTFVVQTVLQPSLFRRAPGLIYPRKQALRQELGWTMGLEPTTTGITTRDSTS